MVAPPQQRSAPAGRSSAWSREDEKGLVGAAHDVEAAGGKACVLPTDVADPEQCEAAAEEVERTFGPIDAWVNVAFTSVFSPFMKMTPEYFHDHVRLEALAFDGVLQPESGGLLRPDRTAPGHRLTVKHADLEPFRVC